jgi:nucleosome binding factor SPN SPT16 subunit
MSQLNSSGHLSLTVVQDQEAQYNLLLALQVELLSVIKDGVSAREIYLHAVSYVRDKNPDLEKYFVKNLGFGVSLALVIIKSLNIPPCRRGSSFVIPLTFYHPRTHGC